MNTKEALEVVAQMEAALTAAFAAMPGPAVKVKPLEWVDRAAADGNSRNSYADTSVGSYEAFELNMNVPSGPVTVFGWSGIPWKKDQHVESFKAAKAAAQADYEARILSALTPAPDLAFENERLRGLLQNAPNLRHFQILAEAMAEVKATNDGQSDQTITEIVDGCLAEIAALERT